METAEMVMSEVKNRSTSTSMKNPYIINLPEGDTIGGWNIDFDGWTGNQKKLHSVQWLSQGYDGILFKGKGRGRSRIRPIADDNFFVGPHNAYVAFESCTIGVKSVVGKGKVIHMGLANPSGPVLENFKCILNDVELDGEGPFVWGLFGYQNDWELTDVYYNPSMEQSREHGLYAHGFAKNGCTFRNVSIDGIGAECLKFTARPQECRFVPNVLVHINNCSFKNWFQPHSWRGGAGLVSQASTAHFIIEDTYYWGNQQDYNRSKCVMIDGNGPGDYNSITGEIGTAGPYNGHVILKHVAMSAATGPAWYTPIMRIGNNSGATGPHCARSFLMEECGVYGKFRQIQIHGGMGDAFKGPGVIRNCNTPQIRDFLFAAGMNVNDEARIDSGGFPPVSQGIVIARD
jgi:hypothetical protein